MYGSLYGGIEHCPTQTRDHDHDVPSTFVSPTTLVRLEQWRSSIFGGFRTVSPRPPPFQDSPSRRPDRRVYTGVVGFRNGRGSGRGYPSDPPQLRPLSVWVPDLKLSELWERCGDAPPVRSVNGVGVGGYNCCPFTSEDLERTERVSGEN